MAKSRCTRREKAEEIANFLFHSPCGMGIAERLIPTATPDDDDRSGWSEECVADCIEKFLRSWKPSMAARKKTRKVEVKR